MSIQVANIDLSAATVGTAGSIPIGQATPPPTIAQQMRPMQNQEGGPSLFVWNESGCGLTCLWPDSRETFTLPAGQWRLLHIPPAETQLNYLVSYIIPNAPVSLLLADLYVPGEPIDPMGVLGNSPIGVSGQVATSTGQSIKNDGNVPATQIIEATPSDQGSSSVSLNNDASGFLQVLSANVLRKILNVVRGNATTGKASIQLGDSGDTSITTLYGTVGAGSVVPPATLAAGAIPAGVTIPGGQVSSAVANATTATTATTATSVASSGSDLNIRVPDTAHWMFFTHNVDASGNYATNGPAYRIIFDSSGNLKMESAASGIAGNAITWSGDQWIFNATGGLTINGGNTALQSESNGGGAGGKTVWEGTTDPAGSAGEGDIWLNG